MLLLERALVMAKVKRKSRRASPKKGRKDSPFWQWLLVVLVALGLYYILDFYLDSRQNQPSTGVPSSQSQDSSEPREQETQNQNTEWTLERAEAFLPEGADPDHFEVYPLLPQKDALLSYGIPLPNKESDPQGLTNTRPGLRLIREHEGTYQAQSIDLSKLEPAIGKDLLDKFMGRPQISSSLEKDDFFLIPVRFFLEQEDREVMAYLYVDETQTQWAPLIHASGKKMPAAFWIGTTEKISRKVRHRKRDQPYLIIEHGLLDELKPYEGFQWKIQAYRWEDGAFRYDEEYSKELTSKK